MKAQWACTLSITLETKTAYGADETFKDQSYKGEYRILEPKYLDISSETCFKHAITCILKLFQINDTFSLLFKHLHFKF